MTVRTPREAEEQIALFDWARLASGTLQELKLLYHIPNGGSRNRLEAIHLKQQGVRSGVPDLCLPVPRGGYGALYIELKRQKGGHLEPKQREWLDALNAAGNLAVLCRGWMEAKATLEMYLAMEKSIPQLQRDGFDPPGPELADT